MRNLKGSTVLVLGSAGQVGFEICKKILALGPTKLVVCDINAEHCEAVVKELKKMQKNSGSKIETEWGNIFVRESLKQKRGKELLSDRKAEEQILKDIFFELNEEILKNSTLFRIIQKHKPDIVIDAINTATSLAYQDPYTQVCSKEDSEKWVRVALSMSIPQLVRHTQILFHALMIANTKQYLKIGTSGTGGLGFTLPYTHGEREVPSKLLMGKTAVAGAQTMLLWVLGRTPGAPIVKEIKVAALIGWRKIGSGKIETKTGPIELYDCPVEMALPANKALQKANYIPTGKQLESVWIDTGENDLFTPDMFAAISAQDGMELITPEEIAEKTIQEIYGEQTGKEVLAALDKAVLGPTVKGMAKRKIALDRLGKLEGAQVASIATLGPLTSKILWEAAILKKIIQTQKNNKIDSRTLEVQSMNLIQNDKELRAKIISIGIPILIPDGRLLRGPEIHVPDGKQKYVTLNDIEKWATVGWVDIRASNWRLWLVRLEDYQKTTKSKGKNDFEIGAFCGWIFTHELGGLRLKR